LRTMVYKDKNHAVECVLEFLGSLGSHL
jgi:hypothetical protein